MFGLQFTKNDTEETLSKIRKFELFCLGKSHLSADQFNKLNVDLSIDAVEYIGNRFLRDTPEGKRLIWTGADNTEHDLGPVMEQNVTRDYPGFNRLRSLALGHDLVEDNETIDIPGLRRQMTVVTLKDGSTGVAPDYKMALRNASLKMHLKHQFNTTSAVEVFKRLHGRA